MQGQLEAKEQAETEPQRPTDAEIENSQAVPFSIGELHESYSLMAEETLLMATCTREITRMTSRRTRGSGSEYPRPTKRSGHWSPEEKLKYYQFLVKHQMNFEKRELRRLDKIFKLMSQHLGSRAADQCRSHHQKMEKKYGSFEALMSNFLFDEHGVAIGVKQPTTEVKVEEAKPATWEETQAGTPVEQEHIMHEHFAKDGRFVIYDVPALPNHEPHMLPQVFEKPTFTQEFEPGFRSGYL